MNKRIQELAEQAGVLKEYTFVNSTTVWKMDPSIEDFAELIVRECVNTLEFHGFDDAVPYIQWMAKNKLGVE